VIHLAAWKNQKTIVDHLLCCWGVDVDMVDLDGFTPLCWAVMAGHVDCVDVLLVHGADPNHKSKKDVSPIDIAKAKGYTVIASMMMEALRCCPSVVCVQDVRKTDYHQLNMYSFCANVVHCV
jgi:ankyrin repeat protein